MKSWSPKVISASFGKVYTQYDLRRHDYEELRNCATSGSGDVDTLKTVQETI